MDKKRPQWQEALFEMTFESRTFPGKIFDVIMLILIMGSIVIVMLDSIVDFHNKYGNIFHILEWIFTILFTIEYLLRIIAAKHRFRFVFSFLGIIDFIAIIPTYITLLITGSQPLLMLRVLRLLRIFRIFRLSHFLSDINFLSTALLRSLRKISVFLIFAIVLVIVLGSLMYIVEKPENGFTSIPECIYWALVTITTVGYGDLHPITPWGKVVASVVMLTGYAIISVPIGIISAEMAIAFRTRDAGHTVCSSCKKISSDTDAIHCKYCGQKFDVVDALSGNQQEKTSGKK